eukprot:IDg5808t1
MAKLDPLRERADAARAAAAMVLPASCWGECMCADTAVEASSSNAPAFRRDRRLGSLIGVACGEICDTDRQIESAWGCGSERGGASGPRMGDIMVVLLLSLRTEVRQQDLASVPFMIWMLSNFRSDSFAMHVADDGSSVYCKEHSKFERYLLIVFPFRPSPVVLEDSHIHSCAPAPHFASCSQTSAITTWFFGCSDAVLQKGYGILP